MPNIQQMFGGTHINFLASPEFRPIDLADETTQEERVQRLWLTAGVFRKWRVRLGGPIPGGQALTLTVRINEADTAMAIAFGPGDQDLSYVGSDIAVAVDDRIDIQCDLTGAALDFGAQSNLEFEPASGSTSCYGHNQQNGTGTFPIYYGAFCGFALVGGGGVETFISVAPCAGTITGLGVVIHTPQTGTHTWTLYKSINNGVSFAATAGSVTFAGGRTGRSTFSVSVNAGDLFYIKYTRVGGSFVNIYGGVSIAFDPAIAGEFIIPGLSRTDLDDDAIAYFPGSGGQGGLSFSPDDPAVDGVTSITLRHLYVYLENPPGDGKSFCFDYTKDGSTSPAMGSPFLTITGTAQTGHDLRSSHWLRLIDGGEFSLRQVPTNLPTVGAMTWAAVGKSGSQPATTQTGCGCDACPESAPPPLPGNIGPIAWLDTTRLQP